MPLLETNVHSLRTCAEPSGSWRRVSTPPGGCAWCLRLHSRCARSHPPHFRRRQVPPSAALRSQRAEPQAPKSVLEVARRIPRRVAYRQRLRLHRRHRSQASASRAIQTQVEPLVGTPGQSLCVVEASLDTSFPSGIGRSAAASGAVAGILALAPARATAWPLDNGRTNSAAPLVRVPRQWPLQSWRYQGRRRRTQLPNAPMSEAKVDQCQARANATGNYLRSSDIAHHPVLGKHRWMTLHPRTAFARGPRRRMLE